VAVLLDSLRETVEENALLEVMDAVDDKGKPAISSDMLGSFEFGIPLVRCYQPRAEDAYAIDSNGILKVGAQGKFEFECSGPPSAQVGQPLIKETNDIESNGTLNVDAQ
ncbi:unnamed protein product, partial [Prorocentrum cordatum]